MLLAEMRLVEMNESWRRGVDWELRECSPRSPSLQLLPPIRSMRQTPHPRLGHSFCLVNKKWINPLDFRAQKKKNEYSQFEETFRFVKHKHKTYFISFAYSTFFLLLISSSILTKYCRRTATSRHLSMSEASRACPTSS